MSRLFAILSLAFALSWSVSAYGQVFSSARRSPSVVYMPVQNSGPWYCPPAAGYSSLSTAGNATVSRPYLTFMAPPQTWYVPPSVNTQVRLAPPSYTQLPATPPSTMWSTPVAPPSTMYHDPQSFRTVPEPTRQGRVPGAGFGEPVRPQTPDRGWTILQMHNRTQKSMRFCLQYEIVDGSVRNSPCYWIEPTQSATVNLEGYVQRKKTESGPKFAINITAVEPTTGETYDLDRGLIPTASREAKPRNGRLEIETFLLLKRD